MNRRAIVTVSVVLTALLGAYWIVRAGNLEPPGPPAPTMKTLVEVEPRIAVNATNTPGNAGTMFIIDDPGSYYLTSDIVQEANKSGIQIQADNVTLDLMGFTMIGNPSANASFVIESEPGNDRTTVRNGTISEWRGAGVWLRNMAHVESMTIDGTSAYGIIIESGKVLNCTVRGVQGTPTGTGIQVVRDSIVSGCNVSGVTGSGIALQWNSLLTESSSVGNSSAGIVLTNPGSRNRVVNNLASENGGIGIFVDLDHQDTLVADNLVARNNIGIRVDGTENIITRNVVSRNISMNIIPGTNNDVGPAESANTGTMPGANIVNP